MHFSPEVIKNTLVDYPRLEALVNFINEVKDLPGEVAEVGVYKGGTARLLCENYKDIVYLFDTFSGMPEVDAQRDMHVTGHFGDTSIKRAVQTLLPYMNWHITQGVFPISIDPWFREKQFKLVHLDVDIYMSVKQCLEFFVPRMVSGGIIVLDDYNADDCPGAKLAADEVMGERVQTTVQCQAIIRF